MTRHGIVLGVFLLLGSQAEGRCPNGCNGKGSCAANNKCNCYPFYSGSDCSLRTCPYDYGFVDAPEGDLNADGQISMAVLRDQVTGFALEGYPIDYGVARTIDGRAEAERWDEGHFYSECSNKGLCNRKTGECECFPGYTGAGCKRTACPGETDSGADCNGHGVCKKAFDDLDYTLWDKHKTMKCECHAGYTGPDCSLRKCMYNADPIEASELVLTQMQKISFATISYTVGVTPNFASYLNGDVFFSISLADEWGEVWTTDAITATYETLCGVTTTTDFLDAADAANFGDYHCEMSPKLVSEQYATATTFDANFMTVADQVNVSLQSLPNDAASDVHVWMTYTSDAVVGTQTSAFMPNAELDDQVVKVRYPEGDETASEWIPGRADESAGPVVGREGYTQYWNSPSSRFPDFQNDVALIEAAMYCEQSNSFFGYLSDADQQLVSDQNTALTDDLGRGSTLAGEGLCIYISTTSRSNTDYAVNILGLSTVTSFDEDHVMDLGPDQVTMAQSPEPTAGYSAEGITGSSTSVTHSDDGTPSPLIAGTAVFTIDSAWRSGGTTPTRDSENYVNIPLVTVENVGNNRYWDVNVDGYPKLLFQDTEAYECSKRGLCDYTTGLCDCFSGFAGADCSKQNAISYVAGGRATTDFLRAT